MDLAPMPPDTTAGIRDALPDHGFGPLEDDPYDAVVWRIHL
jgi:hypothetical protein